jgi:tetratricopeptide (TPR) repeat protein
MGEALGRTAWIQAVRGAADAPATAEAAAAADPEGAWASLALARVRVRQGKADEAVALAQKAVASAGPAAQFALGRALEAKGDLAGAETAYKAAVSAGAEDQIARVGGHVGLARVLRLTGRAAEAEPLLQSLLSAMPGAVEAHVEAYKESARVKLALGRVADAVADAATAAALGDNDPEAEAVKGEVTVAQALAYLAANKASLALQDLTQLRDQKPDFVPARLALARVYAVQRQADPALAELAKAVELAPGSAEAHFQTAQVLHHLKRTPGPAVASYEKALAADPTSADYRTQLGLALLELQQFDRAAAELAKVTAQPTYAKADAWLFQGQALVGVKKYKEAIAVLEKAAALAPDNAAVEAFTAWSYFGLKDAPNFLLHAGKARALGHKEPTLLDYLARVQKGEPIK